MTSIQPSESRGWWSRPCGGRELLVVALPLVISTGFFSITMFVDRMFLLWHSPEEMGAALPSGMLHWTLVCFPLGVAGYVNTFVAQYHGADRPERIGLAIWQAARIGLYTTPLMLATVPLAPWLFRLAGHDPHLYWHEVLYFQVLAFGAGATVMADALSAFFTGRGVTWVVMCVNATAEVVNIVFDYFLVLGRGGFPELGIEGAAWATVLAQWCKLFAFLVLILRPSHREAFAIWRGRRWDGPLFWRIVTFGAPNGLQYLVEGGAFMLITMKMAQLGAVATAASTLAFNINAVAFIPTIGVGIAVSTLVGQQLTRGRADLASRVTWTAVPMVLVYNGLFGAGYLVAPDLFLLGHAAGMQASEFEAIRALSVYLLRFVAAYCLFDAVQIVFVSAVKGAGDTWFVLGNTVAVSFGFFLLGRSLEGFFDAQAGRLTWWWTVVTVWIMALAVTYVVRFWRGRWRTMRVIEHGPELVEPEPTETGPLIIVPESACDDHRGDSDDVERGPLVQCRADGSGD